MIGLTLIAACLAALALLRIARPIVEGWESAKAMTTGEMEG